MAQAPTNKNKAAMTLPKNLAKNTRFGKVALIGKLHSTASAQSVAVLQDIALFLQKSGCEVVLEKAPLSKWA